MAFSDYDQGQIVSQLRAYFQVKHAAYSDFLPDIDPGKLNGDPADPNSPLHNALESLRNKLTHGDEIKPDDPDYLKKIYRLASKDLASDNMAKSVLDIMQDAQTRGPDSLSVRQQRLTEERQRLEQENRFGQMKFDEINRLAEEERAAEAKRTGKDIKDVRGNYRNASEIQYDIGVNTLRLERINAEMFQIDQIRKFQTQQQQQVLRAAQTMVREGKTPDEPAKSPRQQVPAQPPPPPSDAASTYFMNMVVLNDPGISTHTQHVWDIMKSEHLPAGEAIDKYVADFAARFLSENKTEYTGKQQADMKEQLITQVRHLQEVEHSIQGVQPTPQQLADNYIETQVMPKLSPETVRVMEAMKKNGGDFDKAADEYLESRHISGDDAKALLSRMKTEIIAVDKIHEGITAYEGIKLTPEATERVMRESWKTADLPQPADHYAKLLQDKIAFYQSANGGDLDVQTASARAAVDIRAQIDKDRGAPPALIVDENHAFYQNDIAQMEGWMKNQLLIEQQGTVSPEEAKAAGVDNRNLANTSALSFYSGQVGAAYGIHRRANMESTMTKVYQDHMTHPQPDPKPAETKVQAPPVPPQKPFVYEPGPPVMDFGEAFNINNPFRMTVPLDKLDSSQITEQANNFAHVLAFKAGEDGQISLQDAIQGFHQLHDEDFTGMNADQQARLNALAEKMGVTPDQEFAANDPLLLNAMAAYANDMPPDNLPPEWKQAFTAASAAIEMPGPAPVPPPAPVDTPKPDTIPAAPVETGPHLTDSFAGDYEIMFADLQTSYYDYLATTPMAMSMDQMKFFQQVNDHFDTAKDAYFKGGDKIQTVRQSFDFTKFVRDGLEQQELGFVKENWDRLHPYFAAIGENVGPQDYEKGLEVLRARQQDIIGETYNRRGADVRELLQDRQAFNKIDQPFQKFDDQLKEIEDLARKNGITLPADIAEIDPSTPDGQELQRARTGGPDVITPV